jgi:hypothetical protein
MTMRLPLALLALVAASPQTAVGVQLKPPGTATSFADELYEIITPDLYTIRLFQRGGWTGSHTIDKLRNESQALLALSTPEDVAAFSATAYAAPKAVFVNASLLANATLLQTLRDTGSVSAVFLQWVNTTACLDGGAGCTTYGAAAAFGPQSPLGAGTPSAALNPDPDHVWLPNGSGAVLLNLSFPVFQLPDERLSNFVYSKALENAFTSSNIDNDSGSSDSSTTVPVWPYIAGEPHLYFGPEEMTSEQCLVMSALRDGSKYCDPLGGQSVWAAAQNSANQAAAVSTTDKLVVISAALDVRSIVQAQPGVGADQTVSALVAMLAAADAVAGASAVRPTVQIVGPRARPHCMTCALI